MSKRYSLQKTNSSKLNGPQITGVTMFSVKTISLPIFLLLPFLFSACQPQATQQQPLNITQAIVDAAAHIVKKRYSRRHRRDFI
jgi:hypothetical protein